MKPTSSQSSSQSGFTLLEVVIAVAILAVLSYYTATSIQKAVQNKAKIQGDIERVSTLRDAMNIIQRDVQMAFNYRDPNIELYNRAGKARQEEAAKPRPNPKGSGKPSKPKDSQTPDPTPTSPTATEPFEPKKEVVLTHFVGESDNIHFTSLNNSRTQANSQVSNQMEVGYYVDRCRSRTHPDKSSRCLYRRVSNIIDDEVTESENDEKVAFLEDVTRFELRYMGYQEGAEWQKNWKSDENGDDITKNHFPLAVEVTLATQDKSKDKSKVTAMTIIAEIRNPNNPVPKEPENATPGP